MSNLHCRKFPCIEIWGQTLAKKLLDEKNPEVIEEVQINLRTLRIHFMGYNHSKRCQPDIERHLEELENYLSKGTWRRIYPDGDSYPI